MIDGKKYFIYLNDAQYDVLNTINKISSNPKIDTEFGGLIYKIEKDGKVGYGYTPAIRGADEENPITRSVQPFDALKYLPENAEVVEAYHSHIAANNLINMNIYVII